MKRLRSALFLLALAAPVSAASDGEGDTAFPGLLPMKGIMVFYKSQGPLSFVTMTPKDRPAGARELGTLQGVSCQHGLAIPLSADVRATSVSGGYGDGSYVKALEQIKREQPSVAGLYDVRIDMKVLSILGLYQRLCTEVTARAFAL